tara:strand:- start:668 stop:1510 length:843 start_codon:yes stop_codon:yes gene_type:complete
MKEDQGESPSVPLSNPRSDRVSQASFIGGFWNKVFWLSLAMIASGLVVFLSFVWMGKQGIDATSETVVGIARLFKPDEIVETFENWREMEATATDGNILEIATAEATEEFTRKTNLAMFGTTLPLGTTVSEITVPATYRYHIDISEEWFLATDGPKLLVLAPAVRPSLPVAFDTGRMKKKTDSGWGRWDGQDSLDELEKTITSKLALRAAAPDALEVIREESRLAVAKFVRRWLLSHEAWDMDQFEQIIVAFDGEDLSDHGLSARPATLILGGKAETTLP